MVKKRFSGESLRIINNTIRVIALYKDNRAKPTMMKIYNRLVTEGILEDRKSEYKRLVQTIGNARRAKLIGLNDIYGTRQMPEKDIEL